MLQYQFNDFSQLYRPECLSRFDGWQQQKDADRFQWDYAMLLVNRDSLTGYARWAADWQGEYQSATATDYPAAMLGGEVIQRAAGELFSPGDVQNVVALRHKQVDLTQGTSGGAWIANFGKEEDADHNLVIGVTSFARKDLPGVAFGPYLTSDFARLFEYVSNGCRR